MARKNRMSVYDGVYHVTTRIAHRAMLLGDDSVKDEVLARIVSVARFSGVELWAFCIMDNHLHLFVRVPPVPKEYWLDPHDEPVAYAFGRCTGLRPVPFTVSSGVSKRVLLLAPRIIMSVRSGAR